jgi:DNA-3-methyladenine glycosylase
VKPLPRSFFARSTLVVARELIGCILVHESPDGLTTGRIVEAEAYTENDPGSHANRGLTPRNAPMFERPGFAYVYFTYGMHWCLNAVAETDGVAGAVLLRAVEPLDGLGLMQRRRGPRVRPRDLARGPGRLTQAFGIARDHNRADLTRRPFYIAPGDPVPSRAVARTPRIGLGATQDGRPWRFALKESPWVSGGRIRDSRGA